MIYLIFISQEGERDRELFGFDIHERNSRFPENLFIRNRFLLTVYHPLLLIGSVHECKETLIFYFLYSSSSTM